MDAIRCENCETLWLSFIAKDLIQLSGKCLRCNRQHLDLQSERPSPRITPTQQPTAQPA